jgi:riboflavin kinase / FMN adenylyltransferase
MQISEGLSQLKLERTQSVLTIGNFDGVHLGHQELIEKTVGYAKGTGGPSCVYTFRPHPQEVLRPGTKVKLITAYGEKLEIFREKGIDITVEELFSQDFFSQSAESFFDSVVVKGFRASHLVVGHDFAFGKNREGNTESLKTLCSSKGIHLTVVPQKRVGDEVCSSTNIRTLLLAGNVTAAEKLLGRPFFYRGIVRKGDQRGRLLGFPTANTRIENKLELPNGVYATWAVIKKGNFIGKYPSVTNIGIRPTFKSEGEKLVETHVILPESQSFEIYGEELEVQFVDRFREEKKFSSFEDLKKQIFLDREQAKEFFRCS